MVLGVDVNTRTDEAMKLDPIACELHGEFVSGISTRPHSKDIVTEEALIR